MIVDAKHPDFVFKMGLQEVLDKNYVGTCHFRDTEHVAAAPPETLPEEYEQAHLPQVFQKDEDCFADAMATAMRDCLFLSGDPNPEELSIRWIYYWGRYPDVTKDAGTVPDVGVAQVLTRGYCADRHMPYATTGVSDPPSDEARRYAWDQIGKLKIHAAATVLQIKQALVRSCTVHMGGQIDEAYQRLPAGAVWRYVGPSVGGHEYRIIGWSDKLRALKIMGSWLNWSDGGYGWISYDEIESGRTNGIWVVDKAPKVSDGEATS